MHSGRAINKLPEIGGRRNRGLRRGSSAGQPAADHAGALWRFSLAIYAKPGVPDALIGLQDRGGADVNLVLYCLWRGVSGRPTAAADIRAAVRATRGWQAGTVARLRVLRRALKTTLSCIDDRAVAAAVAALREQIKRAELDAERIEQTLLGRLVRSPAVPLPRAARMAAAETALQLYLASRGRRAGALDNAALTLLIAAAASIKM
jgi:uncharacterized protein (TIGR02444 family)